MISALILSLIKYNIINYQINIYNSHNYKNSSSDNNSNSDKNNKGDTCVKMIYIYKINKAY